MKKILLLICFNLSFISAAAQNANEAHLPQENALSHRRILAILHYIGKDYTNAVKSGEIINDAEYAEMQEFTDILRGLLEQDKNRLENTPIFTDLAFLRQQIDAKATSEDIFKAVERIEKTVLAKLQIVQVPIIAPDLEQARKLFMHNCAACHGEKGTGDGPNAKFLTPPPSSFWDEESAELSSPSDIFNIISAGIDGTSMASYEASLTEQERWSLAFFVKSLRLAPDSFDISSSWKNLSTVEKETLKSFSLKLDDLAVLTDGELASRIAPHVKGDDADILKWISLLRTIIPFIEEAQKDVFVSANRNIKQAVVGNILLDELTKTKELVQAAKEKFLAEENFSEVADDLLDAYLSHYEKIEKELLLFDKAKAYEIEKFFSNLRAHLKKKDKEYFQKDIDHLINELSSMEKSLIDKKDTGVTEFFTSFVIIVREGLEAFLVVAALLALIKSLGIQSVAKYIHLGWISAIIAGFLTYGIFQYVIDISGFAKEMLEVVFTFLAICMLFYTGFWLLNQTERNKWDSFIKIKTKQAYLGGKVWSLFFISFVAVYREAAETVLFYSALLSTASHSWMVFAGFACGALAMLLVVWLVLYFNLRLPLKSFFKFTSSFMVFLSVVLTGKAVNELFELGVLTPTPLSYMIRVDLLGLYPYFETIAAQLLLMSFGLVIFWMMRGFSSKALCKPSPQDGEG